MASAYERLKLRLLVAGALGLATVLLIAPAPAHASGRFTQMRFKEKGEPQCYAVSQQLAASIDTRTGTPQVYVRDLSSGKASCITTDTFAKRSVGITGNRVCWLELDGDYGTVMWHDTRSAASGNYVTIWKPGFVGASGGVVVWVEHGIQYADSAGTVHYVARPHDGSSPTSVTLSGNTIYWRAKDTRSKAVEWRAFNTATGVLNCNLGAVDSAAQAFDGTTALWTSSGSLKSYNYSTKATIVLAKGLRKPGRLRASAGRVIWEDHRTGVAQVLVYDLHTHSVSRVAASKHSQNAPLVCGSRVIWLGRQQSAQADRDLNVSTDHLPRVWLTAPRAITYKHKGTLTCMLRHADGQPFSSARFTLQRRTARSKKWVTVATHRAGKKGTSRFFVTESSAQWYRVRFSTSKKAPRAYGASANKTLIRAWIRKLWLSKNPAKAQSHLTVYLRVTAPRGDTWAEVWVSNGDSACCVGFEPPLPFSHRDTVTLKATINVGAAGDYAATAYTNSNPGEVASASATRRFTVE